MITNSSQNPNSFLKAFYSETLLVNGTAVFNAEHNGVKSIIGVFPWYDTAFATHTPIVLPAHTKKALIRVMVREGEVAPKHPAFVSMDGLNIFDFDDDVPYVLNHSANPKCMPLLEGSEIEVYGINEIRKLMFFNNRTYVPAGGGSPIIYNETPVNFLLNITLFK